MFESLSLLSLQQYWWVIISILGSLLVFLMFVQGGQTLFHLGKTASERTIMVNSLGRKWELTFTTLVTFGGAFFASFPLFYSTSFGGAYWLWMIILFCFVVQAISYEYRSKPGNFLGMKVYDAFLLINGALGTFLIGVAVATFFTGSRFTVNEMNSSRWEVTSHGLEAMLNLHNVSLGLSVFFLARVLGLLYFINNISHKALVDRFYKQLWLNSFLFLCFFLTFLVWLLLRDGFAYDPATKVVSMEPHKYWHNLIEMPLVLVFMLLGVVLVLYGLFMSLFRAATKGIWFTGTGTVLTVLALFFTAGFHQTAFYPSVSDLQSSLTIENSSSSHYTLTAMSYVSLFVPLVIGYIFFAWKAIDSKKITEEELNNDSHKY